MKLKQTLSYYIIYPLSCVVGWLPYGIQRALADVVHFVLRQIVHYRRSVIRENLINSFPEMTPQQRLDIEKRFYYHLADIFIDTVIIASISIERITKRLVYLNLEEIESSLGERSYILAMAHYGPWELFVNYPLYSSRDMVMAAYRPLANAGFEKYYYRVRRRFGLHPIPMNNVMRETIVRSKGPQRIVMALIADQSPPRSESHTWINFLNQPTQFFMGIEKMASKLSLPVLFMDVERIRRGHYTCRLEMIYDGREQLPVGEITNRYAQRLEQLIRKCPEMWLWSHRRWKHKPQ